MVLFHIRLPLKHDAHLPKSAHDSLFAEHYIDVEEYFFSKFSAWVGLTNLYWCHCMPAIIKHHHFLTTNEKNS